MFTDPFEPVEVAIAQIIVDSFGQNLDENTACVLLYVLCAKDVLYLDSDGGKRKLQCTQRFAGAILERADSRRNYVNWLGLYSDKISGNFYEMSDEWQPLIEDVIDKLLRHPNMVGIEESSDY
jgi:hypothetical protein